MRPSRHPLFAAIISVLLLLSLVAPVGAAPPDGADALAHDSWIVTLSAEANPRADAAGLARAAGGRVGHIYTHALNGFQFHGSAQAAAALGAQPAGRIGPGRQPARS